MACRYAANGREKDLMAWPAEAGSLGVISAPRRRAAGRMNYGRASLRMRALAPLVQNVKLSLSRIGSVINVFAQSYLAGTIYYHWYIDGAFVDAGTNNMKSFYLDSTRQFKIDCIDTNDVNFDSIANAPAGYPADRSIYFTQSQDIDVSYYRIDQKKDSDDRKKLATITHLEDIWDYTWLSGDLVDKSTYQWWVVPIDSSDNEGTEIELDALKIIRTPNAPDFEIEYAPGTQRVTFSETA